MKTKIFVNDRDGGRIPLDAEIWRDGQYIVIDAGKLVIRVYEGALMTALADEEHG